MKLTFFLILFQIGGILNVASLFVVENPKVPGHDPIIDPKTAKIAQGIYLALGIASSICLMVGSEKVKWYKIAISIFAIEKCINPSRYFSE